MALDVPNSPSNGQIFSGNPAGVTWRYDGVKWVNNTSTLAVSVGDTPPTNPVQGTLWFDSVGAQLYFWFIDPTGPGQWVPATSLQQAVPLPVVSGGTGAITGQPGPYQPIAANADIGRNLIHNPLFNIQQRGQGPWTSNSVYTADRWQTNVALDTVQFIITTLNDQERSQIGDEQPAWVFRNTFTGNSGATAYSTIRQMIEGVRRLAGKTVTISFYANSGSPVKIGINLFQNFGTGGSPSANAWVLPTGASITTAAGVVWSRFSVTVAIPSISGKTLGTNNDDHTMLSFFYSSGANSNALAGNIGVQSGIVNIWGVQLEIGSVMTPLEKPDPQQDLAKCQRFYQVIPGVIASGYNTSGGYFYGLVVYPVAFRASPLVSFANIGYGSASTIAYNAGNQSSMQIRAVMTATGMGWVVADAIASADF